MLEFRDIDISDRDRINKTLAQSDFMGCEYSFANNLAWRRLADSKITFFKDFYIVGAFADEGSPSFVFPSGKGDCREVIAELRSFAEEHGAPLRLTGVTDKSLEMLRELFSDGFTSVPDRDYSDYIYLRSDLAELSGKKYHAKRNHLARFNKLDYEFSPITEKDYDDCILYLVDNYNSSGKSDHSFIAEQFAINTFFSYFDALELKGGIIRIDGKIAAVTVGERLNSDTFCVHIEKADTSYEGIYAGINNLFVRSAAEGSTYINREEDLGLEGLRKAKLSYHPAFILNKHIVTFK